MSFDNYHNGDTAYPNQSQWRIKAESLLEEVNVWNTTTTKRFPLGALAEARDGRLWRYCQAGEALSKGLMCESSAAVANWYDEPQTVSGGAVVAAVGDKAITLLVQTAPTADQWNDGYMLVNNGTGEGEMYTIKEHTLTANPKVTVADAGGIRTATADGTDISIVMTPYKDTLILNTNQAGPAVGVPLCAVADNEFYWSQVHGMCPMLNDDTDTPVIGDYCCQSDSAQGTAATPADIADDIIYGTVQIPAATGEYIAVFLTIE